ncbi:TPA: hypothetical protein SMR42_004769 [Pseudomonas putida]|nr:hypothetical protein [Pseudomonas putida]
MEAYARGVDEVEVSLAYRVGLAQTLDLPGQPRTMQFETIAGVSRQDLEAAQATVREGPAMRWRWTSAREGFGLIACKECTKQPSS